MFRILEDFNQLYAKLRDFITRKRGTSSDQGSVRPTLTMRIDDQGSNHQWIAEVTTPQGIWRSPPTMPYRELNNKLLSMGIDKDEISKAKTKAYIEDAESTYRRLEKEYLPFLQAALAGQREVPPPFQPFIEAWMTYALYCHDEIRPLWEVLFSADAVYHSIPHYDEISWAFLRLRQRGWLIIDGERFGLTPEGRRIIRGILGWDVGQHWFVKLDKWFSDNPPPGEDKADWRAETKVFAKNPEFEYRRLEENYLPFLQAALAGEREVPPPRGPRIEVWFAYALFRRDGMRPLWEVIESADHLFTCIPHYDELSWAFLRLKRRGWLAVEGEKFDLTPEGRHAIQDIFDRDGQDWWWRVIEKWMSEHPLPGDE